MDIHISDFSYNDLSKDELELLLHYNLNLMNFSINTREIKFYRQKTDYVKKLLESK